MQPSRTLPAALFAATLAARAGAYPADGRVGFP
jgi:hypothetical protein